MAMNEKGTLPVDVRRSRMSLLKLSNDTKCLTFVVEMSFIPMRIKESLPYQSLSTSLPFDTEARGNSELAYLKMALVRPPVRVNSDIPHGLETVTQGR